MSTLKRMTIAEIKQQVVRVEGFQLQFEGGAAKEIDAKLRERKQSSGDMSVADWISTNFPDLPKGRISVLRGNGRPAIQSDLKKIRASYPPGFKKEAKGKEKTEKDFAVTTAKLESEKEAIRVIKSDLKKSVREINKAKLVGEREAAFDAIDKALRDTNVYHPRVIEICNTALSSGLEHTQALIERILAAWSHAEREKDQRARVISELETRISLKNNI